MQLTELRIAGFGGQGVIMCASVIGRAASIMENGYATMTQNFGPEARGGACSAQVVLSPTPVLYPYVTRPDIVVLMSQEACGKFAGDIKPGGVLLIEQDLVRMPDISTPDVKIYAIPSTRIAETLGKKMVQNIVMTGFFGAVSGLLKRDSLRRAVKDSAPSAFADMNIAGFNLGYEYGLKHLQEGPLDRRQQGVIEVE